MSLYSPSSSVHAGGRGRAATPGAVRPQTPLAAFKAAELTRATLKSRGGAVEFMHDRLHQQLEAIDQEIALDQAASKAYHQQLAKVERRREELRRLIQQQREFTDNFDEQIGPFEARYSELTHSVNGLHKQAKDKHAAALKLLVDKLNYHPSFKRHDDII